MQGLRQISKGCSMEAVFEFYTERAGVFEFDADLDRDDAEQLAMLEVKKEFGEAVQVQFQQWLRRS